MAAIRVKRGTRAQLNAAATAGQLATGEPYLITDESRLAIGLNTNSYQSVQLENEPLTTDESELWDVWEDSHFYGSNYPPFSGLAISGGATNTPSLASELLRYKHPGIIMLNSSSTNNSGYRIGTTSGYLSLSYNGCLQMIMAVKSYSTITVHAGYHDTSNSTAPNNGWYFEISALSVTGVTADSGTRSTTGTSYSLTADTMYRFEIRASDDYDTITYSVYGMDDSLLWTDELTTNLPGAGTLLSVAIVATNAETTSRQMLLLDYFGAGTWQGWLNHLRRALQGPQGEQGIQGATGPGVASGGTAGQVLVKASATDYATAWYTPTPSEFGAASADHTHDIADLPTDSTNPAALGTASPGIATTLARRDHVHPTTGLMLTTHPANAIAGLSTVNPVMDGVAAPGTSSWISRQDHVHPTDTGRAAAVHTHAASDITSGTLDAARLPAATESARGGVILGADTLGIIAASMTVHVSNTGNDTTGDGSEAAPFATLTRAMEWLSMRRIASAATVTVQLGAGVFSMASLTLSHVDGARIIIRGRSMGDGTGDTTRLRITSGRVNVYSVMTIQHLAITHDSTAAGVYVVSIDNGGRLTLGVINANEPVRIVGGQYGVTVINQGFLRMYGGEVHDFSGRGINAERNSTCFLNGGTYSITIDPNSAGSGTISGTIGISAATAALVQRAGTVNILDCATATSADAYSTII